MKKKIHSLTLVAALVALCMIALQSCGSHSKYGCPERIEIGK